MQNIKAYIMLVCASLFWAGNFMIGKYAFLTEIPPLSLVFYRWLLVWIILLPFTYKEIIKYKETILNNLPLLFFLGFTSVGLFNSFTYLSLIHTQVINASLFNAAIPAIIILLCFLFKIEKTNKFQILGLIISVGGILAIITKLKLNILLSLNFNKGDLTMVIAMLSWATYSALLKVKKHDVSQLCLLQIIISFGLLFLIPVYIFEFILGYRIEINLPFTLTLSYVVLFPGLLSFICWIKGISLIGPNRSGIFLHLMPILSAIMAMIIFDERFMFFHALGALFILSGILISNKRISN